MLGYLALSGFILTRFVCMCVCVCTEMCPHVCTCVCLCIIKGRKTCYYGDWLQMRSVYICTNIVHDLQLSQTESISSSVVTMGWKLKWG